MALKDWLANAGFSVAMETLGRAALGRQIRLAADPVTAQAAALRGILDACKGTEQGVTLQIHPGMDVDEYRRRVPIHSYEDLRAGIERQISTAEPVVAPERPVMYARTSGTTGKPKYIPVTRLARAQAISAQRAMSFAQHQAVRAFKGKILGFGGSVQEETLSDGTPAGAASGLIYTTMPRFVRAKYVLPPSLFALDDYDLKYRLAARLAAQSPDVTLMACANPSTLLRLMQALTANLPSIATEIIEGQCAALAELPQAVAVEVAQRIRRDRPRGAALNALASCGREITIADVWPEVRSVTTWLGGGCAHAAAAVRAQLPANAIMVDAGYVASELRGTIVVDIERGLALPMLGDVFLEFVPVEAWEAGSRETLLLQEIEIGLEYYVVISTVSGLLRYDMNDVVRATGRIGVTPTLVFVRKGRGVTSICGEKLAEDQVHTAIATLPRAPRFFVVLADAASAIYRAYLESEDTVDVDTVAHALDQALARLNIEYAAKRNSGRLNPLAVSLLRPGAGEAYHRHCVTEKSQREAQAKVLALQTVQDFDFDLKPFTAP
jgi:hypothetical protein